MAPGDGVLALLSQRYDGGGGIAQYCRDFLEAVASCTGIRRIDMVARDPSGGPRFHDRKLSEVSVRRGVIAFAAAALWTAVTRRPRLVVCGHLNHLPVAWLAARLAGARLVLLVYGIEAWGPRGGLYRALVERTDRVVAISRYTRARLLDWAALDWHRLVILPNAVRRPPTVNGAGGTLSEAVTRIIEWPGKVILTVGRVLASEAYKGHDRVIRCLPDLLRRWPDLIYVVAGGGDGLGPLQAQAQAAGLSDHVVLLGPVEEEEKAALYRRADVFTMPSTGEGFGYVYLEAAAYGTPVVGLAAAGSVDALREGRLGACVELWGDARTDDPALAAALEAALEGSGPEAASELARFDYHHYRDHVARCVCGTRTLPGATDAGMP